MQVTVSAANTVGDKFYCNYADGSLLQLYACGILTLIALLYPLLLLLMTHHEKMRLKALP